MKKAYMTPREVAELLGVAAETVTTWCRTGRLEGHQLGHRTVRIKRDSVERLLDETRLDRPRRA